MSTDYFEDSPFSDKAKSRDIQEDAKNLPISLVVFFELIDGKYLASNGVEVTTEFLLKHEHSMYHDNGYVIIERR